MENKLTDGDHARNPKVKGLRMTRQRCAVYKVLMDHRDHPTAGEVFDRAKHNMAGISLATVYNCLEALVQHGAVRQVNFERESSRYCPNLTEHEHFHDEVTGTIKEKWNTWFVRYAARLQKEEITSKERKEKMNQVNPKYVLRNYMAQLAIDDANKGDYTLIETLFQLLKKPYEEQPENQQWFVKRPEWARHKVGCSMLSCSS